MTLALLDIVARYATPSKSTTKQWSSPCVFCGGDDRFVILPYGSVHRGREMPPHAFCRRCDAWVTAEMLLQRKEGISWQDAKSIVEGSKDISETSKTGQRYAGKAKKLTPSAVDGAPCQEWQWSAEWFYKICKKALWSEQGTRALQWLRDRGFSDASIEGHDLGYCPQDHVVDWGTGEKIKLYRGIVIPYLGEGQVWKLEIRRATNIKEQRYRTVAGSANALYGYDSLEYRGKAVMCEGVFDGIAMEQALAEACVEMAVVATGSTNGSWDSRWRTKLSLCDHVVVAMDSDSGGEKAAAYWMHRLSVAVPDVRRWAPTHGDVNETWQKDRVGLIDACLAGFVPRKPCKVCEKPSIDEDAYCRPWCAEHFPVLIERFEALEEYCFECGDDLDSYDIYGRAWRAAHKPHSSSFEELPEYCYECFQSPQGGAITTEFASNQADLPVSTDEYTTKSDKPQPEEPIATPANPRPRREKAKTPAMCDTDGCYGIASGHDMTGGQWCPNCKLRRELVDGLFAHDFPRLEYSPTHFIEAGEEQCRSFARAMSSTAVSLALREVAGMAEEALVS